MFKAFIILDSRQRLYTRPCQGNASIKFTGAQLMTLWGYICEHTVSYGPFFSCIDFFYSLYGLSQKIPFIYAHA